MSVAYGVLSGNFRLILMKEIKAKICKKKRPRHYPIPSDFLTKGLVLFLFLRLKMVKIMGTQKISCRVT